MAKATATTLSAFFSQKVKNKKTTITAEDTTTKLKFKLDGSPSAHTPDGILDFVGSKGKEDIKVSQKVAITETVSSSTSGVASGADTKNVLSPLLNAQAQSAS